LELQDAVRLSEFLTFARLPSIAASDNLLLLAVVDTVKDILVRLADSTVQAAFAIRAHSASIALSCVELHRDRKWCDPLPSMRLGRGFWLL